MLYILHLFVLYFIIGIYHEDCIRHSLNRNKTLYIYITRFSMLIDVINIYISFHLNSSICSVTAELEIAH